MLSPFTIQFSEPSTRNCIAYAKVANIVNNDSPIAYRLTNVQLPSFTLDRNAQYGLCYIAGLHVYLSVESRITVRITDVQNFRCARHVTRNAFLNGKS